MHNRVSGHKHYNNYIIHVHIYIYICSAFTLPSLDSSCSSSGWAQQLSNTSKALGSCPTEESLF